MQRTCTSPTSYWPENGLPISSWSSTNPTMPLSRPSAVSASQLDATLGSSQSRKSCSLMRPLEATERLMLRGKLLSCFSISVSPQCSSRRGGHRYGVHCTHQVEPEAAWRALVKMPPTTTTQSVSAFEVSARPRPTPPPTVRAQRGRRASGEGAGPPLGRARGAGRGGRTGCWSGRRCPGTSPEGHAACTRGLRKLFLCESIGEPLRPQT